MGSSHLKGTVTWWPWPSPPGGHRWAPCVSSLGHRLRDLLTLSQRSGEEDRMSRVPDKPGPWWGLSGKAEPKVTSCPSCLPGHVSPVLHSDHRTGI